MYAELFPSAQRFISAVEENVNVELRTISGATGPLRPCLRSPRWIAMVASAQGCVDLVDLVFVRDFMRGRLQLYGAARKGQFGSAMAHRLRARDSSSTKRTQAEACATTPGPICV